MPYHINNLRLLLRDLSRFPQRKLALSIGDSWFQYPLRSYGDIQRKLDNALRQELFIVDDSIPGRDADQVPGRIERWRRLAGSLAEEERPLRAILLSVGGNDVIGEDFARHLKRADEAAPEVPWPWQEQIPAVARRHLRLDALTATFATVAHAYGLLIRLREEFAPQAKLITHTYGAVTPSDAPYRFLFLKKGPWLWNGMQSVGLVRSADQIELTRWLLASFAALLQSLTVNRPWVQVLDTRLELQEATWWDNEIHPRGPGFQSLVDRFWLPAVRQAIQ